MAEFAKTATRAVKTAPVRQRLSAQNAKNFMCLGKDFVTLAKMISQTSSKVDLKRKVEGAGRNADKAENSASRIFLKGSEDTRLVMMAI